MSTRPPRTSSACSGTPICAPGWAPPRRSGCAFASTRPSSSRAWPGSTPRCCATPAMHFRPAGRLMTTVPFFRPEIDDGDIAAVVDVLRSGWITTGPRVQEFEAAFARYLGAAHAVPSALRDPETGRWIGVGALADVACFSFYANKTITTGEGGMATTEDGACARAIRSLGLHGMSHDGWTRFRAGGSWDYAITAPGFKYNMTDVAASLGLRQLARADRFRTRRAAIATRYAAGFGDVEEVEVPRERADRRHAWHLYPIRLRLDHLTMSRDEFIHALP